MYGLLHICANYNKTRDNKIYWNRIEFYIRMHSYAKFSHSYILEYFQTR
jgi:hypothetical protein